MRLDDFVPHVPTPLAHDGRLYMWSASGIVSCCELPSDEVIVLEASDKFKIAIEANLPEPNQATPAPADGRLVIHTESKLLVF